MSGKFTPWLRDEPIPRDTEFLVQREGTLGCCWATFDPNWGGRGAWFNRRGQVVGDVTGWRRDGHDYQLWVRHTFS